MRANCFVVLLMLIFSASAAAADKTAANPADYPLTLHVKSSRIWTDTSGYVLHAWVVVNGKTLELTDSNHAATFGALSVLPPGDYRARVSQQATKRGGQIERKYEFLYADGSRETFTVVGMSE